MRGRLVLVLTLAAGGMLLAQDQAPAPSEPIRTRVDLIRVDVYPSQDGSPVTDLRADEFALFEDGKPQVIETFERVAVPSGGPEATRIEPESIRAGRQMVDDPRVRVFVVFLDSYHMDAQTAQQMREPIRDFLQRALGPDDLVAVMTPEMDVDDLTFTRRTTVLAGLLARPLPWLMRDANATFQPSDEVESVLERCFSPMGGAFPELIARHREKRTLDSLSALSSHLGALRDERKTVLLVSLGWKLFEPDPTIGRRSRNADVSLVEANLCDQERLRLVSIDHRDRIREITGDANRSNVSFYPLSPLRNPAFSRGGSMNVLSRLRELAEETDGLAIVNTNVIDEPVRRLIADTSSYYLIGYQSTNTALDGRFRRIRVEVTRPGVVVRARRGYRALDAPRVTTTVSRPASPVDPLMAAALRTAASANSPRPVHLSATGWAAGTGTTFWVSGELDATTRRDPQWASGTVAEVALVGPDLAVRESVPVDARTGAFEVRIARPPTTPPGAYQVRVTLRPTGGTPITEGVALVVPDAGATLGAPRVFRRGPSTGIRYAPTADVRFRRNEHLRLELPAANDEPASARLVDRLGATLQVPPQVTRRPLSGETTQAVIVDLTLAPLAPGDYALVVTQGASTQVAGFKVVP